MSTMNSAQKTMESVDTPMLTLQQFHKISDDNGGMLSEVQQMQVTWELCHNMYCIRDSFVHDEPTRHNERRNKLPCSDFTFYSSSDCSDVREDIVLPISYCEVLIFGARILL